LGSSFNVNGRCSETNGRQTLLQEDLVNEMLLQNETARANIAQYK